MRRSAWRMACRATPAVLAVMLALAVPPASAHEFDVSEMKIKHPYAIEPADAASDVPVYMTIKVGARADRLVGAQSKFAASATLKQASGDAMPSIELAANSETIIGPNTAFVVLHGMTEPLAGYQYFPMTLTFERAGTIEIDVYVEDLSDSINPPKN